MENDLPKVQSDLHSNEADSKVVKSETPENHGKSPVLKFLLLGILVAIILGAIGGAYVMGRNSVFKELNPTAPAIPPKDPAVYETTPTPDPTADWKTYSDSDFGISFKYPDQYGVPVKKPSPEGKLLTFSINKSITFGAYVKPKTEIEGRGGSVYDLYKVTESGGKYYWSMWFNTDSKQELKPVKILKSQDGVEILLLNNDSFVETIGNEYKHLDGGSAAFINLNGGTYTSIVFRNSPYNDGEPAFPTPDPEFEEMLSTLKFTQ